MRLLHKSTAIILFVLVILIQGNVAQNSPRITTLRRNLSTGVGPAIPTVSGRPSRDMVARQMQSARSPVSRTRVPVTFRQGTAGMQMQTQRTASMPMQTQMTDGMPMQAQRTVGMPLQAQRTAGMPMQAQMAAGMPMRAQRTPGMPMQAQRTAGMPMQTQRTAGMPMQTQRTAGMPMQIQRAAGMPMQAQRTVGMPMQTQRTAGMPIQAQRTPVSIRPRDPRDPRTRSGAMSMGQRRSNFMRRTPLQMPQRGTRPSRRMVRRRRNNIIPINPRPCDRSRVLVCGEVPRGQRPRSRTFCYRNCQQRNCIIQCVCTCVSRSGRVGPGGTMMPSFRPSFGNRRNIQLQNALRMRQNLRPGLRERLRQSGNMSRDGTMRFGLSDSVLASVLANPDVSMLVGPQGINDILAGRPPPLINTRNQTVITGPGSVINTQGNQPIGQSNRPSPMGIPIPLSAMQTQPNNDLMLATLLATSGDFPDAPELQIRSDIPAVRAAPAPTLDIVMPSATIDNSVQVQATSGTAGQSNPTSVNATALTSRINNPPPAPANNTATSSLQNWNPDDLRQFLAGTVKTTDARLNGPSKDECLARRKELWCDPVGVWGETPGVARWCILNCRADRCDLKRCSCMCIEEVLFKQKYEQLRLKAP